MKKSAFILASLAGLAASSAASAAVWSGAGFAIPDANTTGASTSLVVSGDTTSITGITVSLDFGTAAGSASGHSWVGDLTVTLTAPNATVFSLFTRVGQTVSGSGFGNSNDLRNVYTFDDTAGINFWPNGTPASYTTGYPLSPVIIAAGSYRTTAALNGAPTSLNSAFGGLDSNGTWTLKITDGGGGDTGGIIGWSINIVPAPGAATLLGLGGLIAARRRR